jgi:hypothetical protein
VTWVGWRLQRSEALVVLGILGLLAAFLVPTGIQMAHAYHNDGLAACLGTNLDPTCSAEVGLFRQRFQSLIDLADWFTLVPGLIGVLLAAPFILDLEHGTYRLAWTQSITRRRWLAGKLGLPILAALLASVTLILLFTWWRTPETNLDGRLDTGIYDTTGIVVIGYTLFALGLALALGAVWRRSAASLTLAFVGYFAMRIFVDLKVRDHLVSPLKITWSGVTTKGLQQPAFLFHAKVLSQTANIKGHTVGGGGFTAGHTQFAAPGLGTNTAFHITYLPASDFWPLQFAEFGLFVGVAAALIAFTAWWTHQRTS